MMTQLRQRMLEELQRHRLICWRFWCAHRYSRLSSLVLSIAASSFAAHWDGAPCWVQSQEMDARNRWHEQPSRHSGGRRHGVWSVPFACHLCLRLLTGRYFGRDFHFSWDNLAISVISGIVIA